MAFSPENGSTPSNPGISYAPGASPSGRSQPTRSSGSGGGGGGSRNRSDSVKRRQTKNTQTKPRDQSSGQALVQQDVSFGLVRPYIPWNVYDAADEVNPSKTTTSATFVSLFTCAIEPQHARIRVRYRVVMGVATAGEIRLVDRATGNVLSGGGPIAIPLASTVEDNMDGVLVAPTLTGAGAPMKVDVQGRTTAGANTLGLLVVYAVGIGSA
jgi:hypothetical protein